MTRFKIAPALAAAVFTLALAANLRSEDRNDARKRSAEAACKWANAQDGKEIQPCATKGCLHNASSAGKSACKTPDPKPDDEDRKLDLVSADGHVRWYFYCARFVRMAYSQRAVAETASALYKSVKSGISKKEEIPVGALVFWEFKDKNGKDFGHVGIYVGDGSVMHTGANGVRKKGPRASAIKDITERCGRDSYLGWVDPTGEPLKWSR